MAWWIPMAMQAAGTVVQNVSANKQNQQQAAWNRYNTNMGYNVDMANIKSNQMLSEFNAGMAMAAGRFNSQLEIMGADINVDVLEAVTIYNGSLINATTEYNTKLLEDELAMMWESAELDLMLLDQQRERERGEIIASQASSGTVIGEGSNADVLISQQTQAELDSFIVRHNANRQAEKIQIAIDQNIYSGEMAWQQNMFKGAMDSYLTRTNARINAAGTLANAAMQANSILGQSRIQGIADTQTARYKYTSGMANAASSYNSNQVGILNNTVSGLFSSFSSGVQSYYNRKQPAVKLPTSIQQSGTSLLS